MPYSELYIGSAIFTDSFAAGLSKWSITSGTWSTNLSGYATCVPPINGTADLTIAGTTYSNFIASFRARFVGGPANTSDWFAVAIRKATQSTIQTTGYQIYLRYNGGLEIYKGGVGVIATASTGVLPNKWTHVKVIANGSNIKVYVNNVQFLNVTDSGFSSGYLGLETFATLATFRIDYTDVPLQGVNNEYTGFLSSSENSSPASALGTFRAKLAGKGSELQSAALAWPIFAGSEKNNAVGQTIISGDFKSTWAQDSSPVSIQAGGSGSFDYQLSFNAGTLHGPTKLVVTIVAKVRTVGDSVPVTLYTNTGSGIFLKQGGSNIAINSTSYTTYISDGNEFTNAGKSWNDALATDGTILLDIGAGTISANGIVDVDYVRLDFYRQGEFLGLELYLLQNGKPTFGGVVEEQNLSYSLQGYLTEISGADFAWPLSKRLFTQDYAVAASMDQIVRDILSSTGSGLTYAGTQNIGGTMQQSFENENAMQLLVKVANFAKYDFRVDFAKNFIFRPRGSGGPASFSTSPQEVVNIISARFPSSLKEMRNRIIVYYNASSLQPSDGDSWTQSDISLWSSETTDLTITAPAQGATPNPKIGDRYIKLSWNNPTVSTNMRIRLTPLGVGNYISLRQWQKLAFYFAQSVNGTAYIANTIHLLRSQNNTGWERSFETNILPVDEWSLIAYDLPTVADSRGWRKVGTPTDNNIDRIRISWFVQTSTGYFAFDGISFSRDYSTLQLDDLGSQGTYGVRGAYIWDKTRTDSNSANLLGQGELAVRKYPSRKLELQLIGDETLLPGENISVTSSSLKVGDGGSQETYSIREVLHRWSQEGFLTDLRLTDSLIAGLDLQDIDKMLKDEILFSDSAAKGGTGGVFR